jgi:hypothetical protein
MTGSRPPRGSDADASARKDRLVQTRVPRDLETRLKQEARQRRVSVSQFIRNVLEDTFSLVDGVLENVDDIVTESREFASQVRRDAARVAQRARRVSTGTRPPQPEPEETPSPAESGASQDSAPAPESDLSHVHAWNPVILNRAARCSGCGGRMGRGERGYLGLSEEADRPAVWLCPDCVEAL